MNPGGAPPGFVSIHKEIDDAFGEVVENLRKKHANMPEPDFAGQVSGLLCATAIALAKQGKCPRDTLIAFLIAKVHQEYGDGPLPGRGDVPAARRHADGLGHVRFHLARPLLSTALRCVGGRESPVSGVVLANRSPDALSHIV
jgi:hypothetical protein